MSKLLGTTRFRFRTSQSSMPKQLTFKIGIKAKKPPLKKMSERPENFSLPPTKNTKIEVLPKPIQSESDKKEYKVIRLENGLQALLISDLNSLKSKCDEVRYLENLASGVEIASSSEDSNTEESDGEYTDASDSCAEESDGKDDGKSEPAENEEEKMAACALSVGVGSFSDPPHIQGLAHFVEHMLFMGSNKYPKENDFDSFIKKKGGSDNASTDCEITTFYFEIQEKYLAQAMDKFSHFFVSPLMKQEAMQREREAIQSEFALALPSDSHRREQLQALMLPPGHPGRTFSWGNCKSLSAPHGPQDSELHRAAHDFWKRHYSAHRMTAAIQARLPMSTLEKYVVSTFGQIPTNNLSPDDFSKYNFSHDTVTPDFSALYYVKPINKINQINISWLMRSFLGEYRSKPHQYMSWILGHEGEGSLLSYLSKKVWALGMYSGNSESGLDHSSLMSFFTINIVLTKEGLLNWVKVLDCVFSYINMLKKTCPSERIFNEVKHIEDTNFRFEKEIDPSDNVENLSENMHFYTSDHFITGQDLYYDYEPKLIEYVLNSMSPSAANIIVQSQEHPEPIVYDQVEEWFGTEYNKSDIPSEWIERWKTIEPLKEFHLPPPNIFITDDFTLIPTPEKLDAAMAVLGVNKDVCSVDGNIKGEESSEDVKVTKVDLQKMLEATSIVKGIHDSPPTLLRNDHLMELWYKPDYKFRLPNALVYIYFVSPLSMTSVQDNCLVELWCMALNQLLKEKLYAADVAGLSHNLYSADKGIILSLGGFNQKLPALVEVITKSMMEYKDNLTEELFKAVKDQHSKMYHNYLLKPSKLAKDIRFSLLLGKFWNRIEKLEALNKLEYSHLVDVGERFMKNVHLQVLVEGNLLEEHARQVADQLYNTIKWDTLKEDDRPKFGVFEMPLGTHLCRVPSFNTKSANTNITNYYQTGPYCLRESCIIDLVMLLMEEPLFDTLRTKEQLGYSVFSTARYSYGILGFSITVNAQADKHSADHVSSRIEAFLSSFNEELASLTSKAFLQSRSALIKLKCSADVELKNQASRDWHEITSLKYEFNRQQREVECLKQITLEEVRKWFQENSPIGTKNNHRLVSIQVIGHEQDNSKETEYEEAITKVDYSLKFLEDKEFNGDTQKRVFVTDVVQFKENLKMFLEQKTPIPEIIKTC